MANREGLKWSREETILAFELYCRTPFGKISSSNPEIAKLAELLGRSVGSVSLKMANLAHFDPELQRRNIKGMRNASKLDGVIFEEFSKNLEELAYEAEKIKAGYKDIIVKAGDALLEIEPMPPGEYKERTVNTRLGQNAFRTAVLNSYRGECCITGLKYPEMLVASHIKPWAVSDEKNERTNPQNGLCLNAFHDKAFDQGLITIDKNYHIIISSQLKNAEMDEITKNNELCR